MTPDIRIDGAGRPCLLLERLTEGRVLLLADGGREERMLAELRPCDRLVYRVSRPGMMTLCLTLAEAAFVALEWGSVLVQGIEPPDATARDLYEHELREVQSTMAVLGIGGVRVAA